jgi:hypothetical protein
MVCAITGGMGRIAQSGVTLNGVIIVSAYALSVLIALILWALIVIAALGLIHWVS